ncbi:MAG: prephenate dehydrogenase/arogenate dehydrogenase family protein [Gammaproteobacteria bacterium]|nr:prephenate dehydrogenase/arogenate dehydrogenase family protein [Gammaproteobacteria bacterium]
MPGRICIIGVGLIGGSFARALKAANACREIVGAGRNEAQLVRAQELGVIDAYALDVAEAARGADVVVLAVPVGSTEGVVRQLAPVLGPNTILTDVGSTKASVVAAVERALGTLPPRFVPGHPIAGTEKSGVEASFAELFQQRRVILTPLSHTDPEATATVRRLWELAGAEVVEMDVQHHDEVLAATSHLPHLLAFALVDTLARMEERREIFRFAAGGFRDFTRVASSDPQMWHDICLANRDALLDLLATYQADLDRLAAAVREGRGEVLLETFRRAKAARDRFTESG